MIEFIRFVSRISNRNFIFNDGDLQFNVTIVSEDPTTIENVMTAMFQELRIHSLFVIEQDNNFIIHTNAAVQGISEVVAEGLPVTENQRLAQIVTEVFRLNTLSPSRAMTIIRPLLSDVALTEAVEESSQLIVTDLAQNIAKIGQLLKSLDSPLSGLVIGQYLVLNTFPDTLISLAEKNYGPHRCRQSPRVRPPYPLQQYFYRIKPLPGGTDHRRLKQPRYQRWRYPHILARITPLRIP